MKKETQSSHLSSNNAVRAVSERSRVRLGKVVRTIALGAILAFGLLSSIAGAADWKRYPGSMCEKWKGPEPTLNVSSMQNPSSYQYMYVDCPVIADDIHGKLILPGIKVLDRHYSKDVRCSINSAEHKNSTFYGYWSSNQFSEGSSANAQEMLWYDLNKPDFYGIYYFSCRIPPTYNGKKSAIISYGAGEE